MALFDLLGRRWGMGVLWTVCEQGPATFGKLEELCETISPAVLSLRLKELQTAKFIRKTLDGYAPTELGERVYGELVPLGDTAKLWSAVLAKERRAGGSKALESPGTPAGRTAEEGSTA